MEGVYDYEIIGARIKKLRLRSGMTQGELAEELDAKYPEAFCELARRHFLGENTAESNRKAAALYEQAVALLDPEEDEDLLFTLEKVVKELKSL